MQRPGPRDDPERDGDYDPASAAHYWGVTRFEHAEGEDAVLGLHQARPVTAAYARWEQECIARFLPDLQKQTVVDLGCGVGRFLVPLARRSAAAIGVDVAPQMLERARARLDDAGVSATTVCASASETGLRPRSAGVIVCLGLMEHLPAPERQRVLHECHRVLEPGGLLLLEINNARSIPLQRAGDNPHRLGRQLPNGYFCELIRPDEVLEELSRLGLQVLEVTGNAGYSLVRHGLASGPRALDDEALSAVFRSAAQLDVAALSRDALLTLSDQLMILARRTADPDEREERPDARAP